MLKEALVGDTQTRYPSWLWILFSLNEWSLFLKEMNFFTAYGQQFILTSGSLHIGVLYVL